MKQLTLTELMARYDMTKDELEKFINEHRSEFPPGCKTTKTMLFNTPAIEFLDNAFNVHPVDETSQEEAKIQLLTAENTELKGQIEKLKKSYQAKENEVMSSQKELRDMEDKFISLQDSASAGNKQMIEKLRNENDTLRNKVLNFEKLKTELLAAKDKRIAELEDLTSSLEEMVNSNADLTDEKMKLELKANNLAKKLLSLNDKISKSTDEKTALENEIAKLKEGKVLSENEIVELQGLLGGLIKSILGTITEAKLKLEGVEKTVTTIPEEVKEVHTISAVEEVSAPIMEEEPDAIDSTSFAAASSFDEPEIRQDDDDSENEGADAMPPRTPSSF